MINFLVEIYARGDNPDNPPPPLRFLSAPLDPQYPAKNTLEFLPVYPLATQKVPVIKFRSTVR